MECSDSNVAQPMPQGDEKTPLSLSRSPPSRTAAFFCAYQTSRAYSTSTRLPCAMLSARLYTVKS